MLKIIVDVSESGQKAIKYLLRKTDGTKVYLYKLFRKGLILINGRKAEGSAVVKQNDEIYSKFLELMEKKDKFLNLPGIWTFSILMIRLLQSIRMIKQRSILLIKRIVRVLSMKGSKPIFIKIMNLMNLLSLCTGLIKIQRA